MKRIFRLALGTIFLILGVLGLFLPVLQGILFLIVGLLILAPESRRIRNLLSYLRKKYPAVFKHAERMKSKFTRSETGVKEDTVDASGASPAHRRTGKPSGDNSEHLDTSW